MYNIFSVFYDVCRTEVSKELFENINTFVQFSPCYQKT
jgi:hypothetical protein